MDKVTKIACYLGNMKQIGDSSVYTSKSFALVNLPSVKFALLNDHDEYVPWYEKEHLRIVAKKLNFYPVEVSIRYWVECAAPWKFGGYFNKKHTFTKVGEVCDLDISGDENQIDKVTYIEFVHCEIVCVNLNTPSLTLQKPLGRGLWELYEEGSYTDAVIEAGGKQFKIHSAVFASQSKPFKAMFSLNCKEAATKHADLEDVSARAMDAFVKWMYIGEIIDLGVIEELYVLAAQYMVNELKEECAILLYLGLTADNAEHCLHLACAYGDKNLENYVSEFIAHVREIKSTACSFHEDASF